MNPAVEAAWIAGSSGLVGVLMGVSGTVIVARLGFRSTRAATEVTTSAALASIEAQIEADRRNRLWERQAAAYTDTIAIVVRERATRQDKMRGVLTGNKLEQTPAPMDWTAVNARLIAFAFPGVVDALFDAMEAQHDFGATLARFAFVKEMGRVPGHPFFPGTGSQRDAATKPRSTV